jgi:phosphoserine phosphatase
MRLLQRVLVVDLDGTLARGNSFWRWVRFFFTHATGYDSFRLRLVIVWLIASRAFGLVTHDFVKRRIQQEWKNLNAKSRSELMSGFVGELRSNLDAKVFKLLNSFDRATSLIVLATAAPAEYAITLAEVLEFDHCVATVYCDGSAWSNNSGIAKRSAVTKLLCDCGLSALPLFLFTDHEDDIPLMEISTGVYLVNASSKTGEFVRQYLADRTIHLIEINTNVPGE